jgi:two-component system, chemotaxis family, response regulator Rcp1
MSNSHDDKALEILLVEDNPGDARLVKEALAELKLHNQLQVVEDGVEALAYLRREGRYAGAARPDLILLDLNLPKKDGREVLAEVKSNPDWRRIPIVVLTSSESPLDVTTTYDLHANCYVNKPVDFEQYTATVQSIAAFWMTIAKLPARRGTT